MDHEGPTVIQVRQDIFGAADDTFDRAALQSGCKILRKPESKVVPPLDDIDENPPFEFWAQASANGFDFR